MNYKNLPIFILLFLFGCDSQPEQKQENELTYFDLKGYFEKEASRLSKTNPMLSKTVGVNESSETRKIRISDWEKELEIFKDADINKAAWKGMFTEIKQPGRQIYTSNDEKIPVKQLQLYYSEKGDKIKGLQIIIHTDNMLYSSCDTLSYYPDSLYQVNKSQDILLLSKKNYQVSAAFLF